MNYFTRKLTKLVHRILYRYDADFKTWTREERQKRFDAIRSQSFTAYEILPKEPWKNSGRVVKIRPEDISKKGGLNDEGLLFAVKNKGLYTEDLKTKLNTLYDVLITDDISKEDYFSSVKDLKKTIDYMFEEFALNENQLECNLIIKEFKAASDYHSTSGRSNNHTADLYLVYEEFQFSIICKSASNKIAEEYQCEFEWSMENDTDE